MLLTSNTGSESVTRTCIEKAVVLLFAFAVVSMAQTRHITPFTGTWKLNVARSAFNPGPPFKSFTLTFTPDGTRKLDLTRADGESLKASLPWSDGREVAVTVTHGNMRNVATVSKTRGRTFRDTWRENGKVIEKVHGAVSANGRTLAITVNGTDAQGQTFHNHLIFEKQ